MPRETRLIDLIFPGDTNHHGTLFGGTALAHMDKVAFITATRHAHTDFVTASCDRIDFAAPARVGEIAEVTGRIVRTGTRSLTVEAELVAEVLHTGERRLCSRGRFNMVTADAGVRVPATEAFEPVQQDELRMVELVFPDQSNHRHMLFGGHALAAMAKAAFVAATRHCRRTIVLASTRQVTFLAPIQVGEIMELVPKVVATGTRSLQVDVGLWGESLETGERRLAAEGSFTMVAIDDAENPA